jgi:colicin import membrane protein
MARDPSISTEQVNSAANNLLAQGIKPTARAVREKLGGGSMATVLKYLQAWQATQVQAPAPSIALPKDLEQVLLNFVGREVASAKGALEADLASLQQVNGDLIAESERQASAIDSLQKTLDASSEDRAGLSGRLAQMESDLANARDEAVKEREAAEHARTELAKSLLRLEAMPRLEADIDRVRADLETQRTTCVAAEQLAAVLQAKFDALTVAHQKLDAEHSTASAKLLEVTSTYGDERVAHQQASRQLADKDAALQSANELVKQLQVHVKTAQLEAATLTGRLQEQAILKNPG